MKIEQFITLISDIANIPAANISRESHFRDDLGIDSLNMVNLFVELADQTGIEFERFAGSANIKTVDGVYQIIQGGVNNE